jgi:hypothetical protein
MESPPKIRTYRIHLGQVGRTGTPLADGVNREVIRFGPKLEKLFASGTLKPLEIVCAGVGFEGVLDGLKALNEGKVKGKKIVVRLQEE